MQGNDIWATNLSTESSLSCLMWIVENVTRTEVLQRAITVLSELLDAITSPPSLDALASQLISLNFFPLALSVLFARLKELESSDEDTKQRIQTNNDSDTIFYR